MASVGDAVHHVKVGTPVAFLTYGGYAEFALVMPHAIIYILHYKFYWCFIFTLFKHEECQLYYGKNVRISVLL